MWGGPNSFVILYIWTFSFLFNFRTFRFHVIIFIKYLDVAAIVITNIVIIFNIYLFIYQLLSVYKHEFKEKPQFNLKLLRQQNYLILYNYSNCRYFQYIFKK